MTKTWRAKSVTRGDRTVAIRSTCDFVRIAREHRASKRADLIVSSLIVSSYECAYTHLEKGRSALKVTRMCLYPTALEGRKKRTMLRGFCKYLHKPVDVAQNSHIF